jgi:hypothetical protein
VRFQTSEENFFELEALPDFMEILNANFSLFKALLKLDLSLPSKAPTSTSYDRFLALYHRLKKGES